MCTVCFAAWVITAHCWTRVCFSPSQAGLFNRSYAVWDYRGLPHNFHGQICPQYFCGWLGIALLAVFLDDGVRYLAFGEVIEPYRLF